MKVITFFTNEKQLIAKAGAGNRTAQQRLYELHAPRMLSVCRQYLSHLEQAEEAMCNGFLKVFKNLKSFRGEGSFEGWIRRIMIRESISYLRARSKLEFIELDNNLKDEIYDPADSNLGLTEIQQLIDGLSDGYRTVFVLYAVEGYTHKEIAALLQISDNTSKSQLFKARKQLQQQLTALNNYHNGTIEI